VAELSTGCDIVGFTSGQSRERDLNRVLLNGTYDGGMAELLKADTRNPCTRAGYGRHWCNGYVAGPLLHKRLRE